ncbi:amidohydrolase family protein [Thioalkalivibrio sp.]|uniref:amidohydrolase family protein n=1 Tax=Thioalkalivibrio sp. TaxID=2093813 RepID=UPI00397649FA
MLTGNRPDPGLPKEVMMFARPLHRAVLLIVLVGLSLAAHAYEGPLFDAHLHYNPAHADTVAPDGVGPALAGAGIRRAVILARDDELIEAAMRAAPGGIVPFLDVYRPPADKGGWMHDSDLPERMRARLDAGLETGDWRGIGELHLFAEDRHSPVFEALLVMAHERGLPLMIHGDPAVIDRAYEIEPEAVVLWAHAGTFPHPDLIGDYLGRYPNLHADLSMRSERLTGDGFMPLEWQDLLIAHADRFLVGVDTFSATRWREIDAHAEAIRTWLGHLPGDVAARIAFGNAERLFGGGDL